MNLDFLDSFSQTPDRQKKRALSGSMVDFASPHGYDLVSRKQTFFDWQNLRRSLGIWSYSYSINERPMPEMQVSSEDGKTTIRGINYASQDYLSLTSHEAVSEAAIAAIRDYGPHSAGSPALQGNTHLMQQLKEAIGRVLKMDEVLLYPTGWGAGFGLVYGLVRQNDHIVIDRLAHNCLSVSSGAATKNVYRFAHNCAESLRKRLRKIRSSDIRNGILVITEGVFSMDSDSPDLKQFQNLCREFNATLVVDVAHDFGSMGPDGTGVVGLQDMLGEVDVVLGSFSKTFASNGGFVAVKDRHLAEYLKFYSPPHIFSNAISPIQCGIVLSALDIARSDEGERRRKLLQKHVGYLRSLFAARGIECVGTISPIIPVPLEAREDLARLTAALTFRNGLFANLVEYPAVPVGHPRFRMQAMATHTAEHADQAVSVVLRAIDAARDLLQGAPAVECHT